MAILGVRKYGDPVLRRRAERVREVTPEIRATVRDMIDTMYHEVGLGLAAPQVGVALRLMVVDEEKGRGPLALINPEIVEEGVRRGWAWGWRSLRTPRKTGRWRHPTLGEKLGDVINRVISSPGVKISLY